VPHEKVGGKRESGRSRKQMQEWQGNEGRHHHKCHEKV
jgi:hypothetical protein